MADPKKNIMANIIELHVIIPYGPNNLNRDGNGIQKQLTVGADVRGRISSQCKKHSMRESFAVYHTRAIVDVLMDKLQRRGTVEGVDEVKLKKALCAITGSKYDAKTNKAQNAQTAAYSEAEVDALVDYVAGMSNDLIYELAKSSSLPKEIKEVVDAVVAGASVEAEIALFGRMTTAGIGCTIPSAVRFSHLYSIDDYASEFDYFTALDNVVGESSHLDSFSMGSNSYYGYMNVDPCQMYANLVLPLADSGLTADALAAARKKAADTVRESVLQLLRDYVRVHPSGKQNSMSTSPVPSVIFIDAVRDGFPVTMDNVFNGAIRKYREKSIAAMGAERMAGYVSEDMPEQDYAVQAFLADSQVRATAKLALPESIPCRGLKAYDEVLTEVGAFIDEVLAPAVAGE